MRRDCIGRTQILPPKIQFEKNYRNYRFFTSQFEKNRPADSLKQAKSGAFCIGKSAFQEETGNFLECYLGNELLFRVGNMLPRGYRWAN